MPHRKSLGAIWRRVGQRYRMGGTACENCGRAFFPPRTFCPDCRRKGRIVQKQMSGRGKIHSFTVVHVALEGFEQLVPYILAIIELDEGPRVTGLLCDVAPYDVGIGMPVQAVFRKISEDGDAGIIHYGYKFAKVEAAEDPRPDAMKEPLPRPESKE
jgi:uncharacterized OB-fold protein